MDGRGGAYDPAAVGVRQGNQYVAPPPAKVTVAHPLQKPMSRNTWRRPATPRPSTPRIWSRALPASSRSINYKDGDQVKKGTLLFTIEPESYKVKLEQAKAAQISAEATLKSAADRPSSGKPSFCRSSTTTQANYDSALAARDSAQASVDQAKANTRLAQINYDYTQVTAPFDGIVTARQVSLGQYVGGTGTPTVLATIVQHRSDLRELQHQRAGRAAYPRGDRCAAA